MSGFLDTREIKMLCADFIIVDNPVKIKNKIISQNKHKTKIDAANREFCF